MVKTFATENTPFVPRARRCETAEILRRTFFLFLLSFFLFSCTSQPKIPNQVVTINYSPFTEFHMNDIYACANEGSIILKVTDQAPDMYFQFGEPEILFNHAYQIDEEELVVVVNKQSEIQNLSQTGIQNLFGNQAMQVWVYAEGQEMQKVFDQAVMEGRSVSSFAKVAANPQIMLEVLKAESNAVGFIPKSLMDESLKEIYSIGSFPVMAITESEPQGAVKNLIGCLQK